jgi:uncharacterized protein (TIGR02246 family)
MTDEQQIQTLIETWAAAIDRGEFEGAVADRTDDVVMFDVPPPHDGIRGIDAYRDVWPPFLGWQRGGSCFELVELDVTAGADVAYAYALLRCSTPDDLAAHPERRLRLTLGLRKQDGRWLVAHEHHSFPHGDDPQAAGQDA